MKMGNLSKSFFLRRMMNNHPSLFPRSLKLEFLGYLTGNGLTFELPLKPRCWTMFCIAFGMRRCKIFSCQPALRLDNKNVLSKLLQFAAVWGWLKWYLSSWTMPSKSFFMMSMLPTYRFGLWNNGYVNNFYFMIFHDISLFETHSKKGAFKPTSPASSKLPSCAKLKSSSSNTSTKPSTLPSCSKTWSRWEPDVAKMQSPESTTLYLRQAK